MSQSNWSLRRIDAMGTVQAGRQRSPHYKEGVLRPYLRVANVHDGFIDTSDVLQMRFSEVEFETYKLKFGDILLNEGQSLELVGRCALYRGEPSECCFQNTLIRFRPGPETDAHFAAYLFQHLQHTGRFAAIASQTTSIAHLGVGRFATLKVKWPELPEQKKIAEILSTWDLAINHTNALFRGWRRLKRGLMQQLLGQQRGFPYFAGSVWSKYRLGDLFSEREETQRPDLPLLAITADRGVVPRGDIARKDTSPADKRRYKRIMPGDIGYNTMRMWQGVSAVSPLEGIVSPAYTICVPTEHVDPQFMGYLFKYPPLVHQFRTYSQGLVKDTLNLKFHHFSEVKVAIPILAEQRRISAVFATLDDGIRQLQQLRGELVKQKRGLLQDLLTGRVHVRV